MLVNPHPYYKGDDPYRPLNSKPWPNMKSGRELIGLVDADMFVYAAGFAIEHNDCYVFRPDGGIAFRCDGKRELNAWIKKHPTWEEYGYEVCIDFWVEDFDKAELILSQRTKAIRNAAHTTQLKWYLTKGSSLWRNEDARLQPYKGNRTDMRKPEAYDHIREHLQQRYKAKVLSGLEADDGVAALARENPGQMIIISPDKDLRTIPGLQLNPMKPHINNGIVFVSELVACRNLYIQMLMGDKIDNIKGLSGTKGKPGWGPVKARAAMESFITEGDMADFVVKQYQAAYPDGATGWTGEHMMWWEILEETANLLFLRRYRDTQFKWEP